MKRCGAIKKIREPGHRHQGMALLPTYIWKKISRTLFSRNLRTWSLAIESPCYGTSEELHMRKSLRNWDFPCRP
jgi:hypothetical protein